MRALLIASTFAPAIGGAETYALRLAVFLAGSGHDVLVVTDGRGKASSPREKLTDRLEVVRLADYLGSIDRVGAIAWEEITYALGQGICIVAQEFAPNVVISNSLDAAVVGRLVADRCRVPLISTMHEQRPEATPFGEALCRMVYGRLAPEAVLAGSRHYADRALRFCAERGRIHLVYHGVDTDRFNPTIDGSRFRDSNALPHSAFVVGSASRYTQRKGLDSLISAFATAFPGDSQAVLVLAGSANSSTPEYLSYLEGLVEEFGLSHRVRFLTDIPHELVPEFLAACNVVAFPSRAEGLGLAALEALSSGRPTVLTRIPGFDELIADTDETVAYRVAVDDVPGLCEALRDIRATPCLARDLGLAARTHVVRGWDERKSLEKTLAIIQKVAHE